MEQTAKWIWLNPEKYPDLQNCAVSCANGAERTAYCMAEFQKSREFPCDIVRVKIRVSADTTFRLSCNGEFVGIGPVGAGGDFGSDKPMPWHYANCYEIRPEGNRLELFVQVQLSPVVLCEWSQGHGGLFLEADAELEDGSITRVVTDRSWMARKNGAFTQPYHYDARISPDEWAPAAETEPVWKLKDAPIPMLSFQTVYPQGAREYVVAAGDTRAISMEFDRIYAAYLLLELESAGLCRIEAHFRETSGEDSAPEEILLSGDSEYRGFQMHSVGALDILVENQGDFPVSVRPSLAFCCYPVKQQGRFCCSEPELNQVWEVCKWALQICRQTIHLDSPRHQEPLACTGDYYIESLMTAFTFGDMRLARLDVIRTADRLVSMDGWMFHTTYSLIWVRMLWEVYRYTGDRELLVTCIPALRCLMRRFHSYTDPAGMVVNAPNYMFVDWMVVDGYSMHHPPMALGQTCLNAFYYGALRTAVLVLREAGGDEAEAMAKTLALRADRIEENFAAYFYDEKEGLFFDGQNTPQAELLPWRPANTGDRHFSRHSNALAVLVGLCSPEQSRKIVDTILARDDLLDVQPYFMHFVLDAVWRAGLFSRYGLDLIRRWIPMVKACSKGLQEGWYKPEEGYSFDYSHAWGGTPAYQLPARLLGLEMVEPGWKHIRLVPRLYGLDWAEILVPTPFGALFCRMEKDKDPVLDIPPQIKAEIL